MKITCPHVQDEKYDSTEISVCCYFDQIELTVVEDCRTHILRLSKEEAETLSRYIEISLEKLLEAEGHL